MKRFLLLLIMTMAIVSCTDDGSDDGGSTQPQPQPQPTITLSQTALNFDAATGVQTVTLATSDAWTAQVINTRADSWCIVSPTSGAAGNVTLTVVTHPNDTPDDRSASIVIKSGTTSKTINVCQKQKDALTVTASKFEVKAEGGEVKIEVKANINFEYSIEESAQSWIRYETTRALKTSTLVFNVSENNDVKKREAKITIKSGKFNEVVTIYQEGIEPALVISQNEYVVSAEGETIAVEVKSNVDVSIEMPKNVNWVTENTTRAMSTNTYYFDVASNEEYDQRTATILFTNKATKLTEEVVITQAQKDAIVLTQTKYKFGKDGGALDFEIQTNVDVTVTISDNAKDWIQQISSRALTTKKLYFDVAACADDEEREGTITISGGNATQTISVKQYGGVPDDEIWYTSRNGTVVTPYKTNAFGAEIVSNTYENGKGVIKFNGAVTSIGHYAFYNCSSLTSITIPNSATYIGYEAFRGCGSLTNVSIGNSVTSIERWAFYECEILTNVSIGNSVTSIGDKAFDSCRSLTSIAIPNSVTSIGNSAFDNCSSLTNVSIGNSVTSIGDMVFDSCRSLTEVTIPNSVTSIGYGVFINCSSLQKFYGKFAEDNGRCLINDGVLIAYAEASGTEYTIPNSVTSIGNSAFANCSSLTSITIPNSVTSIGNSAFANCSSLTSITIPNSVTSIGEDAFHYCSSLTEATIGNGVTSIGDRTFHSCSSLTSITIPNSVTSIGIAAFYGCSSLTSIAIPNSVTSIGDSAFMYCSSLQKFYGKFAEDNGRCLINDGVLIAYAEASGTEYTIPNSVTSIGNSAFYNCSKLKEITIPNSVTSIGHYAFCGCKNLQNIFCKRTTPPTGGDSMFDRIPSSAKIYVPIGSGNAYKNAGYWHNYASKIVEKDM